MMAMTGGGWDAGGPMSSPYFYHSCPNCSEGIPPGVCTLCYGTRRVTRDQYQRWGRAYQEMNYHMRTGNLYQEKPPLRPEDV